jgi:serine/threonine protein kinase
MIGPNTIVGGRYRVIRTLGGGGMKQVHLAQDLRLADRPCALAEMVAGFVTAEAERKAVEAFRREADILAQLADPRIPQIFDCFSQANRHYLVMEFVAGLTLADELAVQGGKLSPARVVEIALQVLEALRYLHGRKPPVIHRDLKPSNLIAGGDGRIRLIDFGIARHFAPLVGATMIGTHGYAPPEQYSGRPEPRSDLYALGATMHQALSGRDPTTAAPFTFPPLNRLCPDLNPKLAAIIKCTLRYDPTGRPQDADEFIQLLSDAAREPLRRRVGSSRSAAWMRTVTVQGTTDLHDGPTDQWTGVHYPRRPR